MKKLLTALLCLSAPPLFADPVEIIEVVVTPSNAGYQFNVTLRHPDTGWDHYADGWRVELADGTVLGTRVLAHPHVNEQPFTRSLSGVEIPLGTAQVVVVASDNLEGWSATGTVVDLPE